MGFIYATIAGLVVLAWRFWPASSNASRLQDRKAVSAGIRRDAECDCSIARQVEQFKAGEQILQSHFDGLMTAAQMSKARLKFVNNLLDPK